MTRLSDETVCSSTSTCPEPEPKGNDWTKVYCGIDASTAKATLIRTYDKEGMPVKCWIPASQCSEVHTDKRGAWTSYVIAKNWILREKNII